MTALPLTYRYDGAALGLGRRPHLFVQPDPDWQQAIAIERWCFEEFGRQDQKRGIEWHVRRANQNVVHGDIFEFGHDAAALAFRLRWC